MFGIRLWNTDSRVMSCSVQVCVVQFVILAYLVVMSASNFASNSEKSHRKFQNVEIILWGADNGKNTGF
jgi:hypothetical protein